MKQPRFTDELAKERKQTNKKSPDKAVLGMEFPVFAVVTWQLHGFTEIQQSQTNKNDTFCHINFSISNNK